MTPAAEEEHVIATAATLLTACDTAVRKLTQILYPDSNHAATPATFHSDLYPINATVLKRYLLDIADAHQAAATAPKTLDESLRKLGGSAMIVGSTWLPMLYHPYNPRQPQTTPADQQQITQVAETYYRRLGIKFNWDDTFAAMQGFHLMSVHTPLDNAPIDSGIYLDQLERCLNAYINHLAALRA